MQLVGVLAYITASLIQVIYLVTCCDKCSIRAHPIPSGTPPAKHHSMLDFKCLVARAAENGPSVRNFVMSSNNEKLKKLFNESVELVADFRALHLEYAGTYIHSQAQKTPGNPSAVGTGGTPFMVYLRKHRDETRNQPVN